MQEGELIGNYRILKELGRGSASVVFLVEDNNRRKYALKILPDFSTPKHISLLKREALISKRLYHPNIVKIKGYEHISSHHTPSYHCLVLEYDDGLDLGKLLEKKKKLSIKDTVQITWQVCQALEHAHSKGIIHRDIKPQNIIIGKNGTVKITDFGFASATTASIASLTVPVGTPYYISPEQTWKEKGDARSDLYSLGVVMYQMVTGKVPFHAENAAVILDMHRNKKPEEISSSIRRKIPQDLIWFVNKALAKSPNERFQSAREMSRSLKLIADENQIQLEEIKVPIMRKIISPGFYWPWVRIYDLTTDIGANVIWLILTFVIITLLSIFGLQNFPSQTLAFFQATETPTVTIAPTPISISTQTLTPSSTPISVLPTNTSTLTPTAIKPTNTPVPTVTPTPIPTNTSIPTITSSPTKIPPTKIPPTDIPPTDIPPTLTPFIPPNTGLQLGTSYQQGNISLTVISINYKVAGGLHSGNYISIYAEVKNVSQNSISFTYGDPTFTVRDNHGNIYKDGFAEAGGRTFEDTMILNSGKRDRLDGSLCCGLPYGVDHSDTSITEIVFIVNNLSDIEYAEWVIPINH